MIEKILYDKIVISGQFQLYSAFIHQKCSDNGALLQLTAW